MSDLTFQLKALAALVALVLAGSAVRASLKSKRRLPLPPGPPGHWLFGNAIPRAKYVHLVGSITSSLSNIKKSITAVCRMGQPIRTCHFAARRSQSHDYYWAAQGESERSCQNSSVWTHTQRQESVDIMEKEGGLLADRPRAVAAGEIMSRGLRMILAPAGEQFRRLRR